MVLDPKKIDVVLARKKKSYGKAYKEARISSSTAMRIRKGLPVLPKVAGRLAAALGTDVLELIDDS